MQLPQRGGCSRSNVAQVHIAGSNSDEPQQTWWAVQNPGKVKRQEEIVRLERSLKKLQRDLAEKRNAASSQADVLAKLEADLDKIKDREHLCSQCFLPIPF